jgi:two-component system, sensor histidine kinase and response regulator
MQTKYFILTIILSYSGCIYAQNLNQIDSLTTALSNASGKDSVEVFLNLAIEWIDVDNQKSLLYTKKAHDQSIELGDSIRIMRSLRFIGMVLKRLERNDSAIQVMTSVIPFAKRNSLNYELLNVYSSLGGIYLFMGYYDRCLKLYTEAANLSEIEEMPNLKMTLLFNTGLLYYKIDDLDRALEYNFKALAMLRNTGDPGKETSQLLSNIGHCYIFKNEFDTADYYLKEALKECGNNCTEYIKMQNLFGYGLFYLLKKMPDKAESYFLRSYPMAIAQKDFRFQLDHIERLCEIYIEAKRFSEARKLLARADPILSTVTLNSEAEKIYRRHISLYKAIGDVQRLAIYQDKYLQIHDSVFSTQLAVNLTRAEADYQRREAATELKNREEVIGLKDSLISSQRLVIAMTAVTIVLLTLLLFIAVRQNKIKKNANRLLDEKVRERTVCFATSISELKQRLSAREEMIKHILQDTGRALTSISTLCALGKDDSENRSHYLSDIDNISQRIINQVLLFQADAEPPIINDTFPSKNSHVA